MQGQPPRTWLSPTGPELGAGGASDWLPHSLWPPSVLGFGPHPIKQSGQLELSHAIDRGQRLGGRFALPPNPTSILRFTPPPSSGVPEGLTPPSQDTASGQLFLQSRSSCCCCRAAVPFPGPNTAAHSVPPLMVFQLHLALAVLADPSPSTSTSISARNRRAQKPCQELGWRQKGRSSRAVLGGRSRTAPSLTIPFVGSVGGAPAGGGAGWGRGRCEAQGRTFSPKLRHSQTTDLCASSSTMGLDRVCVVGVVDTPATAMIWGEFIFWEGGLCL